MFVVVVVFMTGEGQFHQMAVFVEVTINEIASIVDKVSVSGKVACPMFIYIYNIVLSNRD